MKRFQPFLILLSALFITFSPPILLGDAPDTPLDFQAGPTDAQGYCAKLKWHANPAGERPDAYIIYFSIAVNSDDTKFERLDYVKEANSDGEFVYFVKTLPDGDYSFYIKAAKFNPDGTLEESPRTEIAVVEVKNGNNENKPYVRILNQPPFQLDLKDGESITFQFEAESNIRCPILFELKSEHPDEVTMTESGLLTITASKNKYLVFAVRAWLECDNSVSTNATYKIVLGEKEPPVKYGKIFGKVKTEDGTGVDYGIVTAVSENSPNPDGENKMYRAEVKNGEFLFHIAPGSYRLKVQGESFDEEWFEDASDYESATPQIVAEDQSIEVIFVVSAKPQPAQFVVSGRVTAEKDNSGVICLVQFVPVEYINQKGELPPDGKRFWFQTKTDKDGYYQITLPENYTYFASAMPTDNSIFMPQYYNMKDNPIESDLIAVKGDVENINFVLKEYTNYKNGFSGTVKDSEGEPIKARLIAYMVNYKNSEPDSKGRTIATETDESGYYSFKNMTPGEYVILSIPADKTYLPGYFVMNDFATLSWDDATRIAVGETMLTVMYDIKHSPRKGIKGLARFSGVIYEETGSVKTGDKPQGGGAPVPGVYVYAVDKNGAVSDFVFTDNNGVFVLTDLAVGDYTIFADKVGYEFTPQNVTITELEEKSDDNKYEIKNGATSGVNYSNIPGLSLSPLPANDFVTISFESSSQKSSVTLYSAIGQKAGRWEINGSGLVRCQIDTRGLTSGMYYAIIETGVTAARVSMPVVK